MHTGAEPDPFLGRLGAGRQDETGEQEGQDTGERVRRLAAVMLVGSVCSFPDAERSETSYVALRPKT
jgi:hypothetical protein